MTQLALARVENQESPVPRHEAVRLVPDALDLAHALAAVHVQKRQFALAEVMQQSPHPAGGRAVARDDGREGVDVLLHRDGGGPPRGAHARESELPHRAPARVRDVHAVAHAHGVVGEVARYLDLVRQRARSQVDLQQSLFRALRAPVVRPRHDPDALRARAWARLGGGKDAIVHAATLVNNLRCFRVHVEPHQPAVAREDQSARSVQREPRERPGGAAEGRAEGVAR